MMLTHMQLRIKVNFFTLVRKTKHTNKDWGCRSMAECFA